MIEWTYSVESLSSAVGQYPSPAAFQKAALKSQTHETLPTFFIECDLHVSDFFSSATEGSPTKSEFINIIYGYLALRAGGRDSPRLLSYVLGAFAATMLVLSRFRIGSFFQVSFFFR